MVYTFGAKTALETFGLTKVSIYLKIDKDTTQGDRGQIHHSATLHKNKGAKGPLGEVGYSVHPEGHAEINWFFMEPEHTGKGYGQSALRQILEKHKAVLSDTRGGTTESAQRAFQRMLSKVDNVEVRDLKAKNLGGRTYTDMDGNRTSIWYAKLKDAPGLTDEQLNNIAHNAMYHRRRQDRTYLGALGGVGLGGIAGALLGENPLVAVGSGIMGAVGGGVLTNTLQKKWDEKLNLRGNW